MGNLQLSYLIEILQRLPVLAQLLHYSVKPSSFESLSLAKKLQVSANNFNFHKFSSTHQKKKCGTTLMPDMAASLLLH